MQLGNFRCAFPMAAALQANKIRRKRLLPAVYFSYLRIGFFRCESVVLVDRRLRHLKIDGLGIVKPDAVYLRIEKIQYIQLGNLGAG